MTKLVSDLDLVKGEGGMLNDTIINAYLEYVNEPHITFQVADYSVLYDRSLVLYQCGMHLKDGGTRLKDGGKRLKDGG